jgi:putative FmdB family regulatory protein
MPVYAFRCLDCQRRFEQFLTYQEYGKKTIACPHCGSANVRRRQTRVRVLRSDDSRAEALADELPGLDGLEDDPREMGRAMRKMGKEMGEDLPPEFDDVVDRLEQGQSPQEIEQALPDLGESNGTTPYEE